MALGAPGLHNVTIQAGDGVNGTGGIAGIVGTSVVGHGMTEVYAYAGTGGIGFITGTSTGAYNVTTTEVASTVSTGASSRRLARLATSPALAPAVTASTAAVLAGGNIGNILGQATGHESGSGILDSDFHAGFGKTTSGSIGSITGTTTGFGMGINDVFAVANNGIGAISGASTGAYGEAGIGGNSYFNADYGRAAQGAITSISGTSVDDHGIDSSTFLAGAGIGNIYGGALGPFAGSGIHNSTFNADITHAGLGSIGNITGISTATSGSAAGIRGSHFFSGGSIGNVLGSTMAPGDSAGIADSDFHANAGASATTNGVGSIGTVTGISTTVSGSGWHQGIEDFYFGAGNGNGGHGTIGNISATATVTSSAKGIPARQTARLPPLTKQLMTALSS